MLNIDKNTYIHCTDDPCRTFCLIMRLVIEDEDRKGFYSETYLDKESAIKLRDWLTRNIRKLED